MNPHERFEWCLKQIICPAFQLISLNVFQSNYERKMGYYVISIIYCMTFLTYFYTVYAYDIVTVIMSLTMACMMLEVSIYCVLRIWLRYDSSQIILFKQVFSKYISDWNTVILSEIIDFYKGIYAVHLQTPSHAKYHKMCNKYSKITVLVMFASLIAYTLMASSFFISLAFLYSRDPNDVQPPIGLLLPGCEDHSSRNFVLLFALNVAILMLSVCIVVPYDTLLYVIFANMPMVSTEFSYKIHDFDQALTDQSRVRNTYGDVKLRMHDIIKLQRQYDMWAHSFRLIIILIIMILLIFQQCTKIR